MKGSKGTGWDGMMGLEHREQRGRLHCKGGPGARRVYTWFSYELGVKEDREEYLQVTLRLLARWEGPGFLSEKETQFTVGER